MKVYHEDCKKNMEDPTHGCPEESDHGEGSCGKLGIMWALVHSKKLGSLVLGYVLHNYAKCLLTEDTVQLLQL